MDDADRKKDAPGCSATPPGRKQKGPFIAKCDAGKHAWCRCEKSARYPMCDGSHRGSDVAPIKVVLDEARVVVWCACGISKNAPYCDGSHMRLC
jgi:CDGSH-type Zn-finger protein